MPIHRIRTIMYKYDNFRKIKINYNFVSSYVLPTKQFQNLHKL